MAALSKSKIQKSTKILGRIHDLQKQLRESLQVEADAREAVSDRIKIRRDGREFTCDKKKFPQRLLTLNSPGPKIYVVQGRGTNCFKIGTTNSPIQTRIDSLAMGSAVDLDLVGWGVGGRSLEQRIHKLLQFYRVRGEWFELPDSILWWLLAYLGQIRKETAAKFIAAKDSVSRQVALQRKPRLTKGQAKFLAQRVFEYYSEAQKAQVA